MFNEWTLGIGAIVVTVLAAGGGPWLVKTIFRKRQGTQPKT